MNDDKYDFKYRLDLDSYQFDVLQKYITQIDVLEEDLIMFNEIKEMISNPKKISRSVNKQIAATTATEARTKQAKQKIENAMNLLRLENKKLTYYSIAKTAKVSYQTVKKYITLNEMEHN